MKKENIDHQRAEQKNDRLIHSHIYMHIDTYQALTSHSTLLILIFEQTSSARLRTRSALSLRQMLFTSRSAGPRLSTLLNK